MGIVKNCSRGHKYFSSNIKLSTWTKLTEFRLLHTKNNLKMCGLKTKKHEITLK